jgi:iron complex transport system substrate-binding protein
VISFTPHSLSEIWQGIEEIGTAAGHAQQAQELAAQLARDVSTIDAAVFRANGRPRVLCLEWFDPPYVAGHWVPEMVRRAGAADCLGREGEASVQVTWRQIAEAQPEVILLMSCGYGLRRNLDVWESLPTPEHWHDLPAVKAGRVYAMDANSFFSRPGPRVAQGVALLANLLHPEIAGLPGLPAASVQHVAVAAGAAR